MRRHTYQNLRSDESQFQSLMDCFLTCFNLLYSRLEVQWNQYHSHFTIAGKERRCPLRQYRNRVFEDIRSSLLFILYYLKNSPPATGSGRHVRNELAAGRFLDTLAEGYSVESLEAYRVPSMQRFRFPAKVP